MSVAARRDTPLLLLCCTVKLVVLLAGLHEPLQFFGQVAYEVSGTVDETGSGVGQSWLGKDVFSLMRFGGYSDVVVVPEKQIFEKPASFPTPKRRQSQ